MNSEEKNILKILDQAVLDEKVKKYIDVSVQRVENTLKKYPETLMAWEPIPLDLYRVKLPDEIKSSWLFILRKGSTTGAERHPNSIQRMMSYKGYGDFQTKPGEKWNSHFLESDFEGELEKRWISIPENVWHQGVVGDKDWVVVSFHTAEESELIEERPEDEDGNIHSQKYVDKPINKSGIS